MGAGADRRLAHVFPANAARLQHCLVQLRYHLLQVLQPRLQPLLHRLHPLHRRLLRLPLLLQLRQPRLLEVPVHHHLLGEFFLELLDGFDDVEDSTGARRDGGRQHEEALAGMDDELGADLENALACHAQCLPLRERRLGMAAQRLCVEEGGLHWAHLPVDEAAVGETRGRDGASCHLCRDEEIVVLCGLVERALHISLHTPLNRLHDGRETVALVHSMALLCVSPEEMLPHSLVHQCLDVSLEGSRQGLLPNLCCVILPLRLGAEPCECLCRHLSLCCRLHHRRCAPVVAANVEEAEDFVHALRRALPGERRARDVPEVGGEEREEELPVQRALLAFVDHHPVPAEVVELGSSVVEVGALGDLRVVEGGGHVEGLDNGGAPGVLLRDVLGVPAVAVVGPGLPAGAGIAGVVGSVHDSVEGGDDDVCLDEVSVGERFVLCHTPHSANDERASGHLRVGRRLHNLAPPLLNQMARTEDECATHLPQSGLSLVSLLRLFQSVDLRGVVLEATLLLDCHVLCH
mmetsp:Transcript_12733/g.50870  ORF Transcript_12733/g.50870 Transcript_12733/m.50870 type:complete len:520 (-) Transcript_12733:213-1772(-)